MTGIRVVVGEGQYLRREGVCRLLVEAAGTELVAVVSEPGALLESVRWLRPDAVLTSLDTCAVRREFPRVGVVVLDRYQRPALACSSTARRVSPTWWRTGSATSARS